MNYTKQEKNMAGRTRTRKDNEAGGKIIPVIHLISPKLESIYASLAQNSCSGISSRPFPKLRRIAKKFLRLIESKL